MTYRANEEAESAQEWALRKFTKGLPSEIKKNSEIELLSLIRKYGPVVDSYPSWHPLVAHKPDLQAPIVDVNRCFRGVDHTVQLRHGFITCPYDSTCILNSVNDASYHSIADVEAVELEVPLYHMDAKPVLVTCEWMKPLKGDRSIPSSIAIPLMLEMELKSWLSADVPETWEAMRSYILGRPCGARSSQFVDASTGLDLKKMYIALMKSGAFGYWHD